MYFIQQYKNTLFLVRRKSNPIPRYEKAFDLVDKTRVLQKCREIERWEYEMIARMTWRLRIRIEIVYTSGYGLTRKQPGIMPGTMLFNTAIENSQHVEDQIIIKKDEISNLRMYADDISFIATTKVKL